MNAKQSLGDLLVGLALLAAMDRDMAKKFSFLLSHLLIDLIGEETAETLSKEAIASANEHLKPIGVKMVSVASAEQEAADLIARVSK